MNFKLLYEDGTEVDLSAMIVPNTPGAKYIFTLNVANIPEASVNGYLMSFSQCLTSIGLSETSIIVPVLYAGQIQKIDI